MHNDTLMSKGNLLTSRTISIAGRPVCQSGWPPDRVALTAGQLIPHPRHDPLRERDSNKLPEPDGARRGFLFIGISFFHKLKRFFDRVIEFHVILIRLLC